MPYLELSHSFLLSREQCFRLRRARPRAIRTSYGGKDITQNPPQIVGVVLFLHY